MFFFIVFTFLKSFFSVMSMLIINVLYYGIHFSWIYRKSTIPILLIKVYQRLISCFHPLRGMSFHYRSRLNIYKVLNCMADE